MEEETRLIEMGFVEGNYTWFNNYVEIPADTPFKDIEQIAVDAAIEWFTNHYPHSGNLVHVFVYNVPELGEDE
jgi:hypothetical protein